MLEWKRLHQDGNVYTKVERCMYPSNFYVFYFDPSKKCIIYLHPSKLKIYLDASNHPLN